MNTQTNISPDKLKKSLDLIKQAGQIFPIGAARSGTTILAKLLNTHPQILVTSETSVFLQLASIINKSQMGVKSGILFGKQYHELWSDHLRVYSKELIESFYAKILVANGKQDLKYWGDKHPHHHSCMDFISSLYPNAKYIYIVRDPRDVACSIAQMNSVPLTKALDTWSQFSTKYETFVSKCKGGNIFQLKYEDMVINYEENIKKICSWLDVDFSSEVYKAVSSLKGVDSHSYQYSPQTKNTKQEDFSEKSVGRWMREFSSKDNEYALVIAGEYIKKYGYR